MKENWVLIGVVALLLGLSAYVMWDDLQCRKRLAGAEVVPLPVDRAEEAEA